MRYDDDECPNGGVTGEVLLSKRYAYQQIFRGAMFGKQPCLRALFTLSEHKPFPHLSTYQTTRM
jgi:hypothetical protein